MLKTTTLAVVLALAAAPAAAQLAVSANDNKQINTAGVGSVVANPAPDTITVIDLGVFPPKLVGELPVPNSVVGPPNSVAVAPDESYALVSSAVKKSPADPAKTVDDNRLTVVDLKAMKVVQTVEAGNGAAGVAINPQ